MCMCKDELVIWNIASSAYKAGHLQVGQESNLERAVVPILSKCWPHLCQQGPCAYRQSACVYLTHWRVMT